MSTPTHPLSPPQPMLRLPQVLAWLNCSRSHIFAMRKSGVLPADVVVRFGGAALYDASKIAAALGLEVRRDG